MTNTYAAWLWTRRTGVIAGQAAAALYGVTTIEAFTPIELIAKPRRRQSGALVRAERIDADEVRTIAGMPVTSPIRTALDLARFLPRNEAVTVLDRLAERTGIEPEDTVGLVDLYRGARGMARAWSALSLMDGGTRSPEETRLRLRFHDAGLPHPQTGISLEDGHLSVAVGIGWPDAKVCVSYRGEGDVIGVQQIQRQELIQRLGWFEICVVDRHPPMSVVYRVREALRRRRTQ
jgi:AbiEi antitoxin C-terminal domain